MIPSSKCVAIVCFETDVRNAKLFSDLGHPVPRVVQYQVTIDPDRVSPTGDFIRFGQGGDGAGQGDEITGWVKKDEMIIVEILAECDSEGILRPVISPTLERAA